MLEADLRRRSAAAVAAVARGAVVGVQTCAVERLRMRGERDRRQAGGNREIGSARANPRDRDGAPRAATAICIVKNTGGSIVSAAGGQKSLIFMHLRIVFICVALALTGGANAARRRTAAPPSAFVTSDKCIACHSGLKTAAGEDVSIGYDWRSTIMANAARDPYWHAAVRREVTDHPNAQAAIEDKCSTCHMPMARFDAAAAGGKGQVFANIPADAPMHRYAFDGVSCTVCHQIAADNLGQHASFDGGFEIKPAAQGTRPVYGPHEVEAGRLSVMQSSAQYVPTQSQHVQRSELCATCHTLYTTALNAAGEQVGELPEQVPYQEWYASAYRTERTCQSCHMPRLDEQPISSVLGRPRPELSQHTFRGGNAFMLGIFNKYRGELGVQALPQELDAAIAQTETYLGTAAATIALDDVRRTGSTLALDVAIASTTGHKLPTAYPARRAWLHLTITDDSGTVLFESGRVRPDGSIVGNDNDADAGKFEPHYAEITSPEQVQIYESIMVDANGRPTTGLLTALRYIKDNRLLPRGFDKHAASDEIAVHGAALEDPDFVGGGDRLHYRIDLGPHAAGPLHVAVELLYQSIGYRWANNLRAYDTPETRRFTRYYEDSAVGSAKRLASAATVVPR